MKQHRVPNHAFVGGKDYCTKCGAEVVRVGTMNIFVHVQVAK